MTNESNKPSGRIFSQLAEWHLKHFTEKCGEALTVDDVRTRFGKMSSIEVAELLGIGETQSRPLRYIVPRKETLKRQTPTEPTIRALQCATAYFMRREEVGEEKMEELIAAWSMQKKKMEEDEKKKKDKKKKKTEENDKEDEWEQEDDQVSGRGKPRDELTLKEAADIAKKSQKEGVYANLGLLSQTPPPPPPPLRAAHRDSKSPTEDYNEKFKDAQRLLEQYDICCREKKKAERELVRRTRIESSAKDLYNEATIDRENAEVEVQKWLQKCDETGAEYEKSVAKKN